MELFFDPDLVQFTAVQFIIVTPLKIELSNAELAVQLTAVQFVSEPSSL